MSEFAQNHYKQSIDKPNYAAVALFAVVAVACILTFMHKYGGL